MSYIPTKSSDGWYVIDEDSGEAVNKAPLKSKSEALKMINNLETSKEMAPATKAGPPGMDMPMKPGMGTPPGAGMPPGMGGPPMQGGPGAGGMPNMEMLKEMIRKKSGGMPPTG